MGLLVAIAIVWIWSERCFTPQERRRNRRVFWGVNALILGTFVRDVWNIDRTTRY